MVVKNTKQIERHRNKKRMQKRIQTKYILKLKLKSKEKMIKNGHKSVLIELQYRNINNIKIMRKSEQKNKITIQMPKVTAKQETIVILKVGERWKRESRRGTGVPTRLYNQYKERKRKRNVMVFKGHKQLAIMNLLNIKIQKTNKRKYAKNKKELINIIIIYE